MLAETMFSTRVADSIPRRLVRFTGLDQSQGDWLWCSNFNRRLMPSLKPIYTPTNVETDTTDKQNFIKSWKSFYKLQRYTDGEAFFLCYPAAFQYGIYAKTGRYDSSLLPPWNDAYANDQKVTVLGGENLERAYTSSIFDQRIRKKHNISDHLIPGKDLGQHLSAGLARGINVIQVSCSYPMFGNKRFGHYLGIVDLDARNNEALIAGSLAPFGVYDSPYARVNMSELERYIISSNKLLNASSDPEVNIQDRNHSPGISLINVSLN